MVITTWKILISVSRRGLSCQLYDLILPRLYSRRVAPALYSGWTIAFRLISMTGCRSVKLQAAETVDDVELAEKESEFRQFSDRVTDGDRFCNIRRGASDEKVLSDFSEEVELFFGFI